MEPSTPRPHAQAPQRPNPRSPGHQTPRNPPRLSLQYRSRFRPRLRPAPPRRHPSRAGSPGTPASRHPTPHPPRQRPDPHPQRRHPHHPARLSPREPGPARHQKGLRPRPVRSLHRPCQRPPRQLLHVSRPHAPDRRNHHHRRPRHPHKPPPHASRLHRPRRLPVRLLHLRPDHVRRSPPQRTRRPHRRRRQGSHVR